jgi:hypothetical protein
MTLAEASLFPYFEDLIGRDISHDLNLPTRPAKLDLPDAPVRS